MQNVSIWKVRKEFSKYVLNTVNWRLSLCDLMHSLKAKKLKLSFDKNKKQNVKGHVKLEVLGSV